MAMPLILDDAARGAAYALPCLSGPVTMTHWYTADTHFGHENIIPNARRPFRDGEHMAAVLIERLWDRVGPEDDLWIIGDFAFGPKAKDEGWLLGIFSQLPGARRHLLVGNHDSTLTKGLPWDSVSLLAEVDDLEGNGPVGTACLSLA